jgi:hypothetical protein
MRGLRRLWPSPLQHAAGVRHAGSPLPSSSMARSNMTSRKPPSPPDSDWRSPPILLAFGLRIPAMAWGRFTWRQILLHCLSIDALSRDPAGLPQTLRCRMRVSSRHRLIGIPGIGNESPRARGAQNVTAPKCVDGEYGVGNVPSHLVHQITLSFLTEPNQTYRQRPTKSSAEID